MRETDRSQCKVCIARVKVIKGAGEEDVVDVFFLPMVPGDVALWHGMADAMFEVDVTAACSLVIRSPLSSCGESFADPDWHQTPSSGCFVYLCIPSPVHRKLSWS